MDAYNMGIPGEIVEVSRSGEELHLDWKIPRFLDLPCGNYEFYDSPRFGFSDARWHLTVWPKLLSSGEVQLDLFRDDDDGGPSTRRVTFSLGVRGSGGGVEKRTEEVKWEFKNGGGCTFVFICSRSELSEQEDGLMEGGTITFVCQMKVPGTAATGASSCPDVPIRTVTQQGIEHKVLEDMGKLLDSGNKSDVTVQVQGAEFRVHSSILCARSPVLSAMLEHDTAERASNRITIDHCQPEVFEEYLRYLYTGSVKSLSRQTVFGLYRVADQYLADDLKRLCLEHIRDTLCIQTFCDTVKLALTHEESDLLQLAVDFAKQNFPSIVMSVEWENFICENPKEANEILKKCFGPRT